MGLCARGNGVFLQTGSRGDHQNMALPCFVSLGLPLFFPAELLVLFFNLAFLFETKTWLNLQAVQFKVLILWLTAHVEKVAQDGVAETF